MKKTICAAGLLVLALLLTACTNSGAAFNGSRVRNEDQFLMEYALLNMSDSQTMELAAGDAIDVEIVSDAGEVAVTIQKDGAEPVYQGNQLPTSAFRVTVDEAGAYTLTVTGHQAKGRVSFTKAAGE